MSVDYQTVQCRGVIPRLCVCAFVGHRRVTQPAIVSEALKQVIGRLAAKHPHLAGFSSAASGSDTLFAEEMARRSVPFSLILPFPCERFEQDFGDDPGSWQRAQKLMAQAIDVEILEASGWTCGQPAAGGEQKAADNAAYMDVGYRCVDRSNVLIAVWDGQPAKGFGGTADVVTYARALQKAVILIDSESGAITEERMDTLNELAAGESGAADWPTDPRQAVADHFTAMNTEAKLHGPRSRFLIRMCLDLLLVGSSLGIAIVAFHAMGWFGRLLAGGDMLSVLTALVLISSRTRSHRRWMQCRMEAEVCNSFLATWDIRREAKASHQPRPAIPGMRRLFMQLRLLRQMDRSPTISMDEARTRYNRDRIDDQIVYFSRELAKAQRSVRIRHMAMKICSILASVCVVLVFCFMVLNDEESHFKEWVHFAALALPLLVTSMGLTLITQESVRRAARYEEMLEELKQLQHRLLASKTWDSLARVATDVEEELLQELIEWRSFIRFTRDIASH